MGCTTTPAVHPRLSRRAYRRVNAAKHVSDRAFDIAQTVDEFEHGKGLSSAEVADLTPLDEVAFFQQAVRQLGPPPHDVNPSGSWSSSRGSDTYSGIREDLAALAIDEPRLPPPGSQPVDLEDMIGSRELVQEWIDEITLPKDKVAENMQSVAFKPYNDPTLRSPAVKATL